MSHRETRVVLHRLAAERILIIDGAMATQIQNRKLVERDYRGERFANHGRDLRGDNDILVLSCPDLIETIHEAYLEAGADLIETNTFNATSISQSDYALESAVYDINVQAARLAKRAAKKWTD